jgi:hypothetical protein
VLSAAGVWSVSVVFMVVLSMHVISPIRYRLIDNIEYSIVTYNSSANNTIDSLLGDLPVSSVFRFGFDKVFMDAEEIVLHPTFWGLRLAWSRLVDLGSIDSGSNPGGPTILIQLIKDIPFNLTMINVSYQKNNK